MGILSRYYKHLKPDTDSKASMTRPNPEQQSRFKTAVKFSKEIWHDHQFWLHAVAVKSGAGALLLVGTIGIGYVVSLPFLAATAGIVICSGIVGFGLFGMAAGASRVRDKAIETYYKVTKKEPPAKHADAPGQNWRVRLMQKPVIQKITTHPLSAKMRDTMAWRLMTKLRHKQEETLIGVAGVGSVMSAAIGGWMLVTSIAALPFIALGSLLTVAVVSAVGVLASAMWGCYLTVKGVIDRREKKKAAAAASAAQMPVIPKGNTPALPKGVSPAFDAACDNNQRQLSSNESFSPSAVPCKTGKK